MAKLTTLQMVNLILRNIGEESSLADLSNLTNIQQIAFDKLVESVQEISTDEYTQWKFLESEGSITLTTGNYKYLKSAVTDLQRYDRNTFRQEDSGNNLKYLNPDQWDEFYPNGITSNMTGYPDRFTDYAGYFVFNRQATSNENSKTVKFRYWRQPTLPDTASPSATLDIPEPFDRLVLVSLATMKVLTYLGNDEAIVYKVIVFGDGRDQDGNYQRLIETYASPEIKPRVSFNAR